MSVEHYFISDLHKFSRRSYAELHEPEINKAAARAKTFVLGGDIFDFRWSTLPSLESSIDAAIEWLADLTKLNAACDFHYVLGNHDFNLPFMQALDEFADAIAHFTWHRYYHRIGDCMFLHGDVADGGVTHEALMAARENCHYNRQPHAVRHYLYDVVVHLRAHKAVAKSMNRKQKVASRIHFYLQDIGHDASNGLRHVYFGHTHVPMGGYEYEGLKFHNGGASIKFMDFRILPVDINHGDVEANRD